MRVNFFKFIVFIALFVSLYGCETLTFGGKSAVRIKNDVAYQTIRWNVNSSEADIEYEFRAFVRETLQRYRYKNYVKLFQSNYLQDEGERTYVIKILKNEEAKDHYLNNSNDIIRRTIAMNSNSFNERWSRLQSGMIVEEVYNLLPELANFNAKQVFYTARSELRLSDRWLSFDLQGRLLSFGTGNVKTSPSRNDERIF